MPRATAADRSAPTILLTGFGPFPGVRVNASARLAQLLAKRARRRWTQAHIVSATLPTEWSRGPDRLAGLWRRYTPTIALHFGVTGRAHGLEIETTARNICLDSDDARGARPPASRHDDHGPTTCPSTLAAAEIVSALANAGIPGCLSDDAGTYLCNAILYRSLRHAAACDVSHEATDHLPLRNDATSHHSQRHLGAARASRKSPRLVTRTATQVGFIHIPACLVGGGADGLSPLAGCPLDWSQALDGAMIALETCLAALAGGE